MKKRVTCILFGILFCLLLFLPAIAANELRAKDSHPSRLVDEADLLTTTEKEQLLTKLNEISERQQVDVAVVTVNSLEGQTATAYADDYYDNNHYGMGNNDDGILLLVSIEEREWRITTYGYGITAFTDAGLDYISEQFLPDMSDGDYASAFKIYASLCDDFITKAKTDQPYDNSNLSSRTYEEFFASYSIPVSLGIGIILSFIMTGIMRSKLKSVYSQTEASDYIKEHSLKITKQYDRFLYRHVSKTARPKERDGGSSTHTSSSGRSHGGSGGSF